MTPTRKRIVTVGIDFGAGTTKVAFSVSDTPAPFVEVVNFGHGLENPYYPEYCLPGVAHFGKGPSRSVSQSESGLRLGLKRL